MAKSPRFNKALHKHNMNGARQRENSPARPCQKKVLIIPLIRARIVLQNNIS